MVCNFIKKVNMTGEFCEIFKNNTSGRLLCSLKPIKVDVTWERGIPQRMESWKRNSITEKVEVPEGVRTEAGLQHHFRTVNIVKKYTIPNSLILNSYQTPSKYVTVGRTTKTSKDLIRVGLAGSGDKHAITLILTVTLDGKIVPFQII